jgi:hypothetical protein
MARPVKVIIEKPATGELSELHLAGPLDLSQAGLASRCGNRPVTDEANGGALLG